MSIAAIAAEREPPRWKRAFPDFDGPPEGLPPGFRDASWRNDAMPSFLNAERGLRLWVDYADPRRRGEPGAPRFTLSRVDADGEPLDDILSGDDWRDLLAAIEQAAPGPASPGI